MEHASKQYYLIIVWPLKLSFNYIFVLPRGDGSEYTGSYIDDMTTEDLELWHFERIKRLCAAGADLFAVETIPSIIEALGKTRL